jgi:hypothetical protein
MGRGGRWAGKAAGSVASAPIDLAAGSYRDYAHVRQLCLDSGRGQAWWLTPFSTDEELAALEAVEAVDDWDEAAIDHGIGESDPGRCRVAHCGGPSTATPFRRD